MTKKRPPVHGVRVTVDAQSKQRKVLRLPLEVLWDSNGDEMPAVKQRTLTSPDIKEVLRRGGVHFVVANVGHPLNRVEDAEVFTFWKNEVHRHLYDESRPYLEDYPDGYFYWASEWPLPSGETIIVLEMEH